MRNKSVRKFYELDRSYDLGEYGTPAGRWFVKKRARKRLRQTLKPKMTERWNEKGYQ